MAKTYDEPSDVTTDKGEVLVNGPDGVAVSLTPQAALSTAGRLENAALDILAGKKKPDAGDAPPK